RRLLLDAAVGSGLLDPLRSTCTPAEEEEAIRRLMQRAVRAEEPSERECRQHFDHHAERYCAPDLFEASHILFLAPRSSAERAEARRLASEAIERLQRDPSAFESLAREHSGCSSAASGGSLGQLSRGDTVPEIEAVLDRLAPGEIWPVPVETRFGLH